MRVLVTFLFITLLVSCGGEGESVLPGNQSTNDNQGQGGVTVTPDPISTPASTPLVPDGASPNPTQPPQNPPIIIVPTGAPEITPLPTPVGDNTPNLTPVVTPVVTHVVTPITTPITTPVATPISPPVITPEVTLAPTPVVTPVNTPVVTPINTPVVTPISTPTATPIVTQQPTPNPNPTQTTEPVPSSTLEPTVQPPVAISGKEIFESSTFKCADCHGSDGVSGMFPDLAGEDFLENYDTLASLVLKVTFMAEKYSAPATPCEGGEEGDCAHAVATYILSEFNNVDLIPTEPEGPLYGVSECSINSASGVRRLTKREIRNAIEDSFNVPATVLDSLPVERSIGGFETIGAAQDNGFNLSHPLLSSALDLSQVIMEQGNVDHNCNEDNINSCVQDVLAPYAQLLFRTRLADVDLNLVGWLAESVVESQASYFPVSNPSPIVPNGDQCDTTAQCRSIFGDTANDCVNSQSDTSYCQCGTQRCDAGTETTEENPELVNQGVRTALAGLLMSPKFLFVNIDSSGETALLNQYDIATRLATSLWVSLPDHALLSAAERGELNARENIEMQIDRMIAHEKFDRFKETFFAQWLKYDLAQDVAIDAESMGINNWDQLSADMIRETELFISHLVDNDHPPSDILNAKFSFMNQRLANHYGISGPSSNIFERVEFNSNDIRQGLLTQGAILANAANGTHASIVRRGEFILAALMCAPPPTPDSSLSEEIDELLNQDLSEAEKMAVRDSKPLCAGCHSSFDPVGWAFSEFDASGRILLEDLDGHLNNGVIDPSGSLNGSSFNGAIDMIHLLSERDRSGICVSEKLLMYTLGRSVDYNTNAEDNCAIQEVLYDPQGEEYGLKTLIKRALSHEVVRFQGANIRLLSSGE